jgi:hypothetical protein
MSQPASSHSRATHLLEQIARSLGVSAEIFSGPEALRGEAEELELLSLWRRITDIQARRRVLSLARREAMRTASAKDACS